jgi:hypothetical protein
MSRKSLLMVLAVLALLASSAAFAAEAPAVPLSQEELISTLQVQPDAGEEMPDLDGMQAPVFEHGSFCSYQGQGCKSCVLPNGSSGLRSCEIQRCSYNGVWHNHFVNCGACTTACAT